MPWGSWIFFSIDQPGFCITSCFFSHLSLPNSAFRAMHLHVSEAAEKLEEAQADITRRVVVIARKETVKYVFRRALRNPARTNVFGNVCAPQPWLGSPHLPGIFLPVRVCAGLGASLAEPPLPGWGDGRRGRGGRVQAARGARRDFPEGGTGGTPARGCRKTILMQRQRPDRPAGALREVGERNTVREGKEKSFAGEELSS